MVQRWGKSFLGLGRTKAGPFLLKLNGGLNVQNNQNGDKVCSHGENYSVFSTGWRPNWNRYPHALPCFLLCCCVAAYLFLSCEEENISALNWPFWCENRSLQSTETPADVDRPSACGWAFLVIDYISSFLQTDGLWFDIMWLGPSSLPASKLRSDVGMFLKGLYVLLHRTGLRKLCNLLRIYVLFWSVPRIIFNDFLNRICPILNSCSLHKH